MREIKFRLRDRHNKIVGYEKWYTGSWRADNPDEGYSLDSGWWEASPCWLYSVDNERWTPTYIPHRYKDQYTGLKDKNGKEVYEGDIAGTFYFVQDKLLVFFKDGCFRVNNKQDGKEEQLLSEYLKTYNGKVEVIGNIYESPYLLDSNS